MADTIEVIKSVGAVVAMLTPVALAYIAWQNNKQAKKQDIIHGQINGMQEKLITAEKSSSESIGKEKGIAQQKDESHTTAQDVVEAIKKDPDIDVTKK